MALYSYVCEFMYVCVYTAYLKDETLWAGELVVPHGFVHEQEEQAGQEGQSDEDQTSDLSKTKYTHEYTHIQLDTVVFSKRYSNSRIRCICWGTIFHRRINTHFVL